MTAVKPKYLRLLGSVILIAIAVSMRLGAINQTVVDVPIRADAAHYYNYALNLKYHQVYSRDTFPSETPPKPDALRAPGYAAFLVPFVEYPASRFMIWKIGLAQALLDSLTVLLALSIFRRIMAEGWALGAGFLTAISPHLISAGTYMLTETLFTFLLMLSLWLTTRMIRDHSKVVALAAGLVIAAAALTRPTLQYFIVPLTGLLWVFHRRGGRASIIILLAAGFILGFSPWVVRNLDAIHSTSDPRLMINGLHHGMYPDFRYDDDPKSTGMPYRYDPRSKEISRSKETVLGEIKRRFEIEPARHLEWYLLGKPKTLFSWNIVGGFGDIFVYPVLATPYASQPAYTLSHKFMKMLHWPLVILALAASALMWLPGFGRNLSADILLTARMLSLLMLYFVALHVIAAPFPRYSIPLRPVTYGLALFLCSQILVWLRSVIGWERVPVRKAARRTPYIP